MHWVMGCDDVQQMKMSRVHIPNFSFYLISKLSLVCRYVCVFHLDNPRYKSTCCTTHISQDKMVAGGLVYSRVCSLV